MRSKPWAAYIVVWRWNRTALIEAVQASARQLPQRIEGENLRFSGFLVPGLLTYGFHFGYTDRYQQSDESLEIHLELLLGELKRRGIGYRLLKPFWQRAAFSMLLGLREGFATDAPVYPIDEVLQALPASVTRLRAIEIYSARSDGSVYTEPACLIQFPRSETLDDMRRMAVSIQQEFVPVVERTSGRTYTMDTRSQ